MGVAATVSESVSNLPAPYYYQVGNYSGGYSFGVHGALGARLMLADNLAVYAEIALNYQNYAPGKSTFDGSTITYASSGTYVPGGTTQPQIFMPFSSAGINAGVQFTFAKNAKPAAPSSK